MTSTKLANWSAISFFVTSEPVVTPRAGGGASTGSVSGSTMKVA